MSKSGDNWVNNLVIVTIIILIVFIVVLIGWGFIEIIQWITSK